jgi:hypothetical protein
VATDINSYAPPADPTEAAPSDFRSATVRTWLVVGLLGVQILVSLLLAIWLADLSMMVAGAGPSDSIALEPAVLQHRLQTMLSQFVTIPYVAAWLAYFVWIYGVQRNLPALGVAEPQFSPGWAVAWYLIPIMALFKPFEAMRELWFGSDPGLAGVPRENWPQRPVPLVRWWWGLHLGAYFVQYAVQAADWYANTAAGLQREALLALAALLLLHIPHALLKLILVRRVRAMQLARHRELVARQLELEANRLEVATRRA